ncbi:Hypothetical predicted protein [Mytilus galloprovincialis]|uniref:CUB domain-containing protein n=1 Tax=Mytilus galloprovincialis TaxID=29158 RepID=A0A8B6D0Q5_MYTGA|nr:Hypothetical predicted protein [Mytilus galloprovincialis]
MIYVDIVISVTILQFVEATLKDGWCEKYSKRSFKLQEDISIRESSHTRYPNCQWQIQFENATKLLIEVKIDQMPFNNIIEYGGFQGQKHTVKYDMLTIVEGDCNHGNATLSFSETVQTTTRSINAGSLCFQYKSESDSYTDNRLQLRVRLTVKEVKCRIDQIHTNSTMWCRTVCFPGNRSRENCQMPTTKSNTNQLSTAKELQQTGKTSSFKSTSRPATTNSANKKMTELPETSTQASFTTSVNNLAPITTSVNNLAQKHTTGDILTTHYRNNVHLSSKTTIDSTTHTNIVVSIRNLQTGLYISSTIAGVFTVTIIFLLICCVKKTKDVEKLTTIMVHLSRSKAKVDHNKFHRIEMSGWSSVTSSLRPSLPPRPLDLPSIGDTKSHSEISHYRHSDEVYDNIGNIPRHEKSSGHESSTLNLLKQLSGNTHTQCQGIDNDQLSTSSGRNPKEQSDDQRSIGNQSQGSGVYIDNTSIKSNTYRQVHKFRN